MLGLHVKQYNKVYFLKKEIQSLGFYFNLKYFLSSLNINYMRKGSELKIKRNSFSSLKKIKMKSNNFFFIKGHLFAQQFILTKINKYQRKEKPKFQALVFIPSIYKSSWPHL
jgi:hypothetical protein